MSSQCYSMTTPFRKSSMKRVLQGFCGAFKALDLFYYKFSIGMDYVGIVDGGKCPSSLPGAP